MATHRLMNIDSNKGGAVMACKGKSKSKSKGKGKGDK